LNYARIKASPNLLKKEATAANNFNEL